MAIEGTGGWRRKVLGGALSVALATLGLAAAGVAQTGDPLDPGRNVPIPCELVAGPGAVPRSAENIAHVANVCGFVGTDVEFQSRTDTEGDLHDFAFVGTMGAGLRIFDVTDPAHPVQVGGFVDPGWQGDIQVRGDRAVIGFDPIGILVAPLSNCLQSKGATGGVDILDLNHDPATATFAPSLMDCVANNPGGAHNSTLHPSGDWLALSNPRTNGTVDVVDLRGAAPVLAYRIVQDATLSSSSVCPPSASFTCISNGRTGNWSPHDLFFSEDGNTMYVAAVRDDTVIVDVTNVLTGSVSVIGVAPNDPDGDGVAGDPHDIDISHQSDTTADGKLLVITDERGGGVSNTECNTDPDGVIGGMHFWALGNDADIPDSIDGSASPSSPERIGGWFYPNPTLPPDVTGPRLERACTIHVFRIGGNGSSSPGPAQAGFDGVSTLGAREVVAAHYGAGVWHIDFSGPPGATDGIAEAPDTTWGNTLGFNIMPGAETWSAKEYKGFIYAGDMGRGFDVYRSAECVGIGCVTPPPTNTPGKATGGGQIEGELAEMLIVRGTTAGGRANFGFNAQFSAGDLVPSGHLTFNDHGVGKKVKSTSIDSYTQVGNRASFTGTATVNGVPGITFFVEVEDFGEPGGSASSNPDTFRIVLGDGYGAAGVLVNGNIQVHAPL